MKSAFKIVLSLLFVVISLSALGTTPSLAISADCLKPGQVTDIAKCWGAETQTTYSMDNMLCSSLNLIAQACPYSKIPTRKYNPSTGSYDITLNDPQPGGGAMGSLASAIGALYTPPTSTVEYLAYVRDQINPVKPAYAQVSGSGAGIISPILKLWTITRNFAYLGFTIIFLVVGFMIMFRQKIGQQAIVTVQAALPGLIIGLILVTFSYFISALIIDTAFVGVQLVAQLFVQAGPNTNALGDQAKILELARNSNILDLFKSSVRFTDNVADVTKAVNQILLGADATTGLPTWTFTTIIQALIFGLVVGLLGPVGFLIGAAGGAALGVGGVDIVAGGLGVIIPLILIIALFIQFFRLLFKLINAYIAILIATVTAPFIILFSSLPGKSGSLSNWWKTILGNALIFPAVFGAFLFAGLILATPGSDWNARPPLFGSLPTGFLRLIIAYGIILGTPAVPDMVKAALGVKDIKGIPEAALGGAMAGFGVGKTGYTAATSRFKEEAETSRKAYAEVRAGTRPAPGPGRKWWYRAFGA